MTGSNGPANDEGGTPGTMSSRSPAPSNLSIEDMEQRIHRIKDQNIIWKKNGPSSEVIIEVAEAAVNQTKETLQVKEYILQSAHGTLDVLKAFYDKAIALMQSLWRERLMESDAEIQAIEAKIDEARQQAVANDASSTGEGA